MRHEHIRSLAAFAVLSGIVCIQPVRLRAQAEGPVHGMFEVGVRAIAGDHASSKFNEYRDIPKGPFVRYADLNFDSLLHDRLYANFQTRDTREGDQTYLATFGMHHKFRFEFRWDQTPHVFTNTASSFLQESSPGVFTAPGSLRTALQRQPGTLASFLDGAAVWDMSLRRDTGTSTMIYTPSANWSIQLQYGREKQTGHRPFGTTTNQFTHIVELPEPIDYRTNQVKLGAEYANQRWGFQTNYTGSFFDNAVSTLVWDVPFLTADAQGGSARGRLDLYPNNSAHTGSFAAAVNVSPSTRVLASFAPGWMHQNDAFLPFTVNSAINTGGAFVNPCPGVALTDVNCLPARSLNGSKQTFAMNYEATTRAIRAVPITVRYHSYDYNNNTPSLIFSDWVKTDTQLVGTARRSMPFGYARQNVDVDGAWEFVKNSSFDLFYGWEKMNRAYREVAHSNEHTLGAAFDINPRNWLSFKTSYRHSRRRPEHYEIDEETWPYGEGPETDPNGGILAFGGPGPGLGQIEGLRKFDQAARSRHRVDALMQVAPWDKLAFTAAYGTVQDNYHESEYGLLKNNNFNYSLELTYNLHPAVSLFGEYTREKLYYRQRSRQRTPANPTRAAVDSPNSDWASDLHDLVNTVAAGVDAAPSRRVVCNIYYTLSIARDKILTRALGDPRLPGFLPTTAVDYPDTNNRWHELIASVKFPMKKGITPRLEYRYERYDRMDFQMTNVGRYFVLDPSTAAAVFLRADVPGYNAHIVAASLEYRF